MHRPFYSKRGGIRPSILSLFILLSFLILPGLTVGSRAQGVYSAEERIYLKNITPLLYEFSQVASDVSASVLKLQSAAPEECSSKFADYRGIVGSLAGQLGSMTPPPRLETVHGYAMQALEGYSKGLGLYFNACTEKDYGVKESLVRQGSLYLNKSVVSVGKAYDEIENVKSAGSSVAKKETDERITEGEIIEGAASTTGRETRLENTAAPKPPARETKSEERVPGRISKKVEAEVKAEEGAETTPPAADSSASEPAPPLVRHDEVSMPAPSKLEAETTTLEKAETPEVPATEPAPPPTEAPSLKSTEEPAPETASTGEGNVEVPTEEGGKETAGEESGKGRIEKLNQKIMEQAKADQGSNVSDETGPIGAETPIPANGAPGEGNQEVAVVPPGGTAEGPEGKEGPADDIKSWCEDRYQLKTEREECMKNRAVAKDKMDKLSNSYSGGTKEREVLDKCMSDWREGGTYNYEMVISCTQFFCTQRGIEDCKDLSK